MILTLRNIAKGHRMPAERLQSALVDRPQHVHAIGMIAIEIALLERSLSELFEAVTGIHWVVAETIYYTPKAAIARIEVISNVAELCLIDFPSHLKSVEKLLKRAKASFGKRHKVMHDWWVIGANEDEIGQVESPFLRAPKKVTLNDLRTTVDQIQILNGDIVSVVAELRKDRRLNAAKKKRALGWLSQPPKRGS